MRVSTFSFLEYLQAKGLFVKDLEKVSYTLVSSYIEEYLIYGGYPAVVMASTREDKRRIFEDIIGRYIEKDFQTYISTTDMEMISFRKLLQFVTRSIGSIRKARKVAQESDISAYTVKKYIRFLKDSYMIDIVFPYYQDRTKEYNAHYEVFFHDHALINYFMNTWHIADQRGRLIENAVYTALKRRKETRFLYYRKSKTQSEIDFIVELYAG